MGAIPELAEESCGLPAIERKLVAAMLSHDLWGLCCDHAALNVRCFEYHVYSSGGALLDPNHRDQDSLLTVSVLLSEPEEFSGGAFITWMPEDGRRVAHPCG